MGIHNWENNVIKESNTEKINGLLEFKNLFVRIQETVEIVLEEDVSSFHYFCCVEVTVKVK